MVVRVVEVAAAHHHVESVVGKPLQEQVIHDRRGVKFDLMHDAQFCRGSGGCFDQHCARFDTGDMGGFSAQYGRC